MIYDEAADLAEKQGVLNDLSLYLAMEGASLAGWRCLEIGGEGGILAAMIAARAGHVTSTDIVPPQIASGGAFTSLLAQKMGRHGFELPVERLEFLQADAMDLQFRDDWFDFTFSQNAFEHIPDPEKALREAFRVTRPGGFIYAIFDPIWTADSGSHFLHRLDEPWLHLIEDDDQIASRMRANGADEGEITHYRTLMNRIPAPYYLEMFPRVVEELGGRIALHHSWSGTVDPAHAEHPNRLKAAEKLGLEPDALLIRGLRYLIQV